MASRKILSLFATVVLIAHASSADTRAILEEYAALQYDLGLLNASVVLLAGVKLSDPKSHAVFSKLATERQRDLYCQAVNDAHNVFGGLKKQILDKEMKVRSPDIAARLKSVIEMITPKGQAHWDLADCMLAFMEIVHEGEKAWMALSYIRDDIAKQLEARTSEIARFVDAAKRKDPAFFSQEQEDEIGRLEKAIEEAKWRKIAYEEQVQAVTQDLAQKKSDAEKCVAQKNALAEECKALQAEIERSKSHLTRLFTDTLEKTVQTFHQRRAEQMSKPDEIDFRSIDTIPLGLKEGFQSSIRELFDGRIKTFSNGRKDNKRLPLVLVVEAVKFEPIMRKVDLRLTLNIVGASCPVVTYLEKIKVEASGRLSMKKQACSNRLDKFLFERLPKLLQVAEQESATEDNLTAEAEANTRRLCSSLQMQSFSVGPVEYQSLFPGSMHAKPL